MKAKYRKIINDAININAEGEYQIFIRVAPHVNIVDIDIQKRGEGYETVSKNVIFTDSFYYSGDLENSQSSKDSFIKIKRELEKLKTIK